MTTDESIAELEAQIAELRGQQADLRKQLAKAELDQWKGRVEDLEVQLHLGVTAASDKLTELMNQLRSKWADARRQLEESISTATSVADTVRAGLEKAFDDIHKALLESRKKLA
jgi:chromosome segregation ATPase